MDETKSLSQTEGSQPPAEGSGDSLDETKSLTQTEGSQPPAEGSGDSLDETKSLSETEGSNLLGWGSLDKTNSLSEPGLTARRGSRGSPADTKSLSGTEGSQPPACDSSGSSDGDPSRIGRYRIIRRLGQGGFGRVYLAHDDDLDRPVAIKVPNPERITHPEDVEAYLNEARILARLDHPNIVPVYRRGSHGRRTLLRGLEARRRQRPGGQDRTGSTCPSGIRRNWSPPSPRPCITPTPEGWSTGTSSPPTSSSTLRANPVSPTSGLPSRTRTSARVAGWLELQPT